MIALIGELDSVTDQDIHAVAAGKDGFIRFGGLQQEIFPVRRIRRFRGQPQRIPRIQFPGADHLGGSIGGLAEEILGRDGHIAEGLAVLGNIRGSGMVLPESPFKEGGAGFQRQGGVL